MKNTNFWDASPCWPLKVNGRCGGTYSLHFQGRRMGRVRYTAWKQVESRAFITTAVRNPRSIAFWNFIINVSLFCKVHEMHSDYGQWAPIRLHIPETATCIPVWELFCLRVLGTVIIFIKHSWLRNYATSRNVAGLIPDVTGIFKFI
jgi:hypothetical protein